MALLASALARLGHLTTSGWHFTLAPARRASGPEDRTSAEVGVGDAASGAVRVGDAGVAVDEAIGADHRRVVHRAVYLQSWPVGLGPRGGKHCAGRQDGCEGDLRDDCGFQEGLLWGRTRFAGPRSRLSLIKVRETAKLRFPLSR